MQISAINSINPVNFQGRSSKDFDREVYELDDGDYEEIPYDEDVDAYVESTALAVREQAIEEAKQDVSPLTVIATVSGGSALFALFKGKVMPPCRKLVVKVSDAVTEGFLKLLNKTSILGDDKYGKATTAIQDKVVNPLLENGESAASGKLATGFDNFVKDVFSGNEKAIAFLTGAREKLGIHNAATAIDAAGAAAVAYVGSDILSDRTENEIDKAKIEGKVRSAVEKAIKVAETTGIV